MTINAEQRYLEALPGIRALAASFASSTSIPADDFIGVANGLFPKVWRNWTGQSSFRTYYYKAARRAMNKHAIRYPAPYDSNHDIDWEADQQDGGRSRRGNPRRDILDRERIEELLEGLSEEAVTVARMAMCIFDEVPSALGCDSGRHLRAKLRDHLYEERNWKRVDVAATLRELREHFGGVKDEC